MKQPYDEVIILCFRIDNPRTMLVPGASKTKCSKCQKEVWIAPSSLKIQKKMKAIVVCDVCHRSQAPQVVDILPLNNDQIGEIKDAVWNQKNRN